MIVYSSCPNCGDKNIYKVLSAKDHTVSGEEFEIWECNNCTQRFTQNIPEEENIGAIINLKNTFRTAIPKKVL